MVLGPLNATHVVAVVSHMAAEASIAPCAPFEKGHTAHGTRLHYPCPPVANPVAGKGSEAPVAIAGKKERFELLPFSVLVHAPRPLG